ncbi:TOTE conflict system archaeo-eukaryotic primase domain-containing protein [Pontiella sulfatireligans]|uniref:TOTE conflict system primase domain-containing protein n=1 Tax=Pontiella sulfatireligans TaxID=2750658 RepID=A0A6C2UFZ1_9BACT|nr:hypothetical protein [Pontiella sulfatireligans]VGO19132.1 hypothetical protein SCARR_01189 [Pontiella sulfatireligans]
MHFTQKQVELFGSRFAGRTDVYGTYDSESGRSWQVKKPVTIDVANRHLSGVQPLGVYPLVGEKVFFAVVDFDSHDKGMPTAFRSVSLDAGISTYIERSKSKGYHCWWFAEDGGVEARLMRIAMRVLLQKIGAPSTEIFPKQDRLLTRKQYGNFINLPLFGRHVLQGRTAFLNEHMKPFEDQWAVLASIQPVSRNALLHIARKEPSYSTRTASVNLRTVADGRKYGLKPCAERMLAEGVTDYQRVACFRLAVQLKLAGYAYGQALGILNAWARRNRPNSGKPIIRDSEIHAQAHCAYKGSYRGMGCEDPAVMPFCDSSCPLKVSHSVGVPQ